MESLQYGPERLASICRQYNVGRLSLFGSFLHNGATTESDVDLLVTFSGNVSLFHSVACEMALSEVFGRTVDLTTAAVLSPYLRDRILKDREKYMQSEVRDHSVKGSGYSN
jgi:uncharacterized protein